MKANINKLKPSALQFDVSPAPESLIRIIKCDCLSLQPYSTAAAWCSCSTVCISCDAFCTHHGDDDYRNPQTITRLSTCGEEYDEETDADPGTLEMDSTDTE